MGTARQIKRDSVGSLTKRATMAFATITAPNTGTCVQANYEVVKPPASIRITGETAAQLIIGI